MRVAKIEIRNILGIEELEIEPGAITVLEGRNGIGKTSTVEAIRNVIEGGHDATLIRNGADFGEVVLVLDDETEIRKRIGPNGSTVSVRRPDVGEIKAPQSFIARLTDALSVNPIAFLTADPKRQAAYLLESLPLELPDEDLAAAVGDTIDFDGLNLSGHALDALERARKAVYDERTGVNRAAKEKRATVGQLAGSLPAEVPAEDGALPRVEQLRQRDRELRDLARARAAEIERKRDTAVEEIRAETQRRIDAVKEEAQREKDAALEEFVPAGRALAAEIAAAEAAEREADRHANTRQVLAGLQADVAELEGRAAALTEALGRVEALRTRLLSKLPIPGLEVVDGVIQKGGVPFSRLNRAEQVKVAIALARLRAGEIKLICVDGIECLDGKTLEAFRENAAKTDLQFVLTRVNPDPAASSMEMTVTTATAGAA